MPRLLLSLLILAFAGCSAHTNVNYGAGVFSGGGTTVSASGGSVQMQASGATAAVLIGLGVAASLSRPEAVNDGVRYRVNPWPIFGHRPAPELAPERKVSEQDCTRPLEETGGNLRCR